MNPTGRNQHFPPQDLYERFWSKVRCEDLIFPENGCMFWTGAKINGYGKFPLTHKKTVTAHRWNYEQRYGPVAQGMQLDHLCRVRHCVNPDHLEPVTSKININRGDTGMRNRSKTRCPNGHPYDSVNKRGDRFCSVCRNTRRREQRVYG